MKISITSNSAFGISTDLLAVGVTTDLAKSINAVEGEFAEHLLAWASDRKFKGDAGSSLVVPTFGNLNAKSLMLVGIGEGSSAEVNQAAAMVGKEARAKEASSVVTMLPGEASMIAQWVSAGNYKYEPYKPADFKTTQIETLTICGDQSNAELQRAMTLIKHQSACRSSTR